MLTGATSSKAFVLRVPDSVPTNGRTKNALLFVDRKGVVLVLVGSQGRSPRELRSRDLLNPSGLKKRLESWFIVGRFLSDHHWPVLGDHRGWPDPEGRRPAGRGVAHAHLQIGAGPPRCPCRSAVCAVILPSHPRILLQSPFGEPCSQHGSGDLRRWMGAGAAMAVLVGPDYRRSAGRRCVSLDR